MFSPQLRSSKELDLPVTSSVIKTCFIAICKVIPANNGFASNNHPMSNNNEVCLWVSYNLQFFDLLHHFPWWLRG